jgi:hypothetical protein
MPRGLNIHGAPSSDEIDRDAVTQVFKVFQELHHHREGCGGWCYYASALMHERSVLAYWCLAKSAANHDHNTFANGAQLTRGSSAAKRSIPTRSAPM